MRLELWKRVRRVSVIAGDRPLSLPAQRISTQKTVREENPTIHDFVRAHLGTRLPWAMVPLAEKPFILEQLDDLLNAFVERNFAAVESQVGVFGCFVFDRFAFVDIDAFGL